MTKDDYQRGIEEGKRVAISNVVGIIKKHAKNGYWGTEIDKVLKEIEGKK